MPCRVQDRLWACSLPMLCPFVSLPQTWHGLAWYGMAVPSMPQTWHGTTLHGSTWHGMAWHGHACPTVMASYKAWQLHLHHSIPHAAQPFSILPLCHICRTIRRNVEELLEEHSSGTAGAGMGNSSGKPSAAALVEAALAWQHTAEEQQQQPASMQLQLGT